MVNHLYFSFQHLKKTTPQLHFPFTVLYSFLVTLVKSKTLQMVHSKNLSKCAVSLLILMTEKLTRIIYNIYNMKLVLALFYI